MKLQGFELEIEGDRHDASVIGRSIGEQISAIVSPGMNIIDGEISPKPSAQVVPAAAFLEPAKRRAAKRSKPAGAANGETTTTSAVEFRHDPSKYASPSQHWSTSDKAIWLLYVVREVASVAELSNGQLVKTFNTHFRQAKTITHSNVSRDLGKLKTATPSLVGEDNTKTPSVWFLTDEGIRHAQAIIVKAKTPAAA